MLSLIRRLFGRKPAVPIRQYTMEGVSAEEAAFIETALLALPEFDHRVLSMFRESPNSVIVHTGEQFGPLCGSGDTLRVVRGESGWQFELVAHWVS